MVETCETFDSKSVACRAIKAGEGNRDGEAVPDACGMFPAACCLLPVLRFCPEKCMCLPDCVRGKQRSQNSDGKEGQFRGRPAFFNI